MTTPPTNKKEILITNRAEAEKAMTSLRVDDAEVTTLRAEQSDAVAKVTNRYQPKLLQIHARMEATTAALITWAKSHPDEFAEGKTIALASGTICKRLGTFAVEPREGIAWEAITKKIASVKAWAKKYLRVTTTVNKQALIADRDALKNADLKKLGVHFVQHETLTVSVKEN